MKSSTDIDETLENSERALSLMCIKKYAFISYLPRILSFAERRGSPCGSSEYNG